MERKSALIVLTVALSPFLSHTTRAESPTTRPLSAKFDQLIGEIDKTTADVEKANSQKSEPFKLAPFDLNFRPSVPTSPNIETWRQSTFNGQTVTIRPALNHETINAVRIQGLEKVILHRDIVAPITVDRRDRDLPLIDDRPRPNASK